LIKWLVYPSFTHPCFVPTRKTFVHPEPAVYSPLTATILKLLLNLLFNLGFYSSIDIDQQT